MTPNDTGPGPDFERLAADAAAIESGRPAAPAAQPPDPAAVALAEADELMELAGLVVLPLLPVVFPKIGEKLAACYGIEQRAAIGRALAAVAVKRGWSISEIAGRYGPELALCAAVVGPALPVVIEHARSRRATPPAPTLADVVDAGQGADPSPAPAGDRTYSQADDGRVK